MIIADEQVEVTVGIHVAGNDRGAAAPWMERRAGRQRAVAGSAPERGQGVELRAYCIGGAVLVEVVHHDGGANSAVVINRRLEACGPVIEEHGEVSRGTWIRSLCPVVGDCD